MNIKEIREEKKKVEEIIHKSLTDFTAKTGLVVEDVNLQTRNQIGFTELQYVSVTLDIKI